MPVPPDAYTKIDFVLRKAYADTITWDLDDFVQNNTKRVLYFLNAHGVNTCLREPTFADILLNGEYLLRDGVGIQIAFKWLGLGETVNLNGTDLIPHIIEHYKDRKIVIYGASDETLHVVTQKLQAEGHANIASTLHGFYDPDTYVKDCTEHKPDLVILCMGMPKQELLSRELLDHTNLVICGGGWADFYSGVKQRAPVWMRKAHIEWVHRLLKEPKRLGKRYTVDIIQFFTTILKVKNSKKKLP